ncbi:DUF3105 domain-containing protein [Candidatus Saccharibacteria bacterium]|nr:DUF3105 domain-containing protein [Candidatus Saccharibacteria bacterium]
MSNKVFIGIIAVLLIGTFGFITIKKRSTPEVERPGVAHEDKGRQHVADNAVAYGGTEAPTSGDHSDPLPWQAYEQEVPDINVIHNMEHGGVYISYKPDLPAEEITKIKAIFFQPFSRENFNASKVILAPRATNEAPIIMSSWLRSMKLESFDEDKMVEYYRRNVGKSPEPAAS